MPIYVQVLHRKIHRKIQGIWAVWSNGYGEKVLIALNVLIVTETSFLLKCIHTRKSWNQDCPYTRYSKVVLTSNTIHICRHIQINPTYTLFSCEKLNPERSSLHITAYFNDKFHKQLPHTTDHGVAISLGILSSSSFHTWRHPSFGTVRFLISIQFDDAWSKGTCVRCLQTAFLTTSLTFSRKKVFTSAANNNQCII